MDRYKTRLAIWAFALISHASAESQELPDTDQLLLKTNEAKAKLVSFDEALFILEDKQFKD